MPQVNLLIGFTCKILAISPTKCFIGLAAGAKLIKKFQSREATLCSEIQPIRAAKIVMRLFVDNLIGQKIYCKVT